MDSPPTYRRWCYGSYRSGFKRDAGEPLDDRRLEELYGRFLGHAPGRVLELGAGTGDVVDWLSRRGVAEAWGVDGSAEQVSAARARGRDVREGDLFEALAGCGDASLDGLVALDVLEHLTRDELVRVALESARVLGPGGAFLVQVPNGHALRAGPIWAGDLTHETLLSEPTLAQLFAPAGLAIESAWGVTPGHGKISRTVRTVAWKLAVLVPKALDIIEAGRPVRIYERVFCAIVRKPS